MAFEGLSDKLQSVFKKLKGKGVLSESDINEAMREVKLALLEADVNFKVVKDFVESVKVKSLGKEVLESLTPAQQVITVSYTHLRAHETRHDLVCRLLLEKKKTKIQSNTEAC